MGRPVSSCESPCARTILSPYTVQLACREIPAFMVKYMWGLAKTYSTIRWGERSVCHLLGSRASRFWFVFACVNKIHMNFGNMNIYIYICIIYLFCVYNINYIYIYICIVRFKDIEGTWKNKTTPIMGWLGLPQAVQPTNTQRHPSSKVTAPTPRKVPPTKQ